MFISNLVFIERASERAYDKYVRVCFPSNEDDFQLVGRNTYPEEEEEEEEDS